MAQEADIVLRSRADEIPRPNLNVAFDLDRLDLTSIAVTDGARRSIRRHCDRFNRYGQFLDGDKTYEAPEASAKAVNNDLLDIYHILRDAERAIHMKSGQLERNIWKFSMDVEAHCSPRWYRNVDDLTAFDEPEFLEILDDMHVPDICDFAAYLRETLPRAVMKEPPEGEYWGLRFLGKVNKLLEKVLENSQHNLSIAMSVFVTVKARVFNARSNRAIFGGTYRTDEIYVNHTIGWLLRQYELEKHPDQYWDFAAAWRELIHGWNETDEDPGALLKLLERFRKRAEAEVQTRTMIAIDGRRLPNELADLMIEFAALAEEIPM